MRPTRLACVATLLAALPACGARSGLDAPSVDPGPAVVVHTEDCIEAGVTSIYVVTSENTLFSFDPHAGVFSPIGHLDCIDAGSAPFSMAVDRQGHAYVVFRPSGHLFRVSTVTATCLPTGFLPNQNGFNTFGMGFSTKLGGPDETLFVAESSFGTTPSKGLGTIDTTSFALSVVAPFVPNIANAIELTGTGDGRLFGLFIDTNNGFATSIGEIDKSTGAVPFLAPFSTGLTIDSFAFAFWGGDFYVFHAGAGPPTTVTRWNPGAGIKQDVAMLNGSVVGVGVSTCAPAR